MNKKDIIKAVKEATSDSLKFSFRFGGSSSSITLSKKICSLYLMLVLGGPKSKVGYSELQTFVNNCLNDWTKPDCRGFGEYVTTQMIYTILDRNDFDNYMFVYSSLSKS
jgi:hypothetical protein